MFHYVYLPECQDDRSWYIGQNDDLRKRVKDHQGGYGGRSTSLKKNWQYFLEYLQSKLFLS